ncbi:MAG: hypothetical protein WAV00_12130 [Nocardioides sp.]
MPEPRQLGSIKAAPTSPSLRETPPLDPSVAELAATIQTSLRAMSRHANCGDPIAMRTLLDMRDDLDDRCWHAVVSVHRTGTTMRQIALLLRITPRQAAVRYGEAAQARYRREHGGVWLA